MSSPSDTERQDFHFVIAMDLDGKHRWYLHNASGSIVDSHEAGFPTELEAYQDVERVRGALAVAPIIRETPRLDATPARTPSAL